MERTIIILAALLIFANLNFNSYNKEIEFLKNKITDQNKKYAILIDYSKLSSKDRMFLVNLKTRKIVKSFKVAHGRGKSKYFSFSNTFSNKIGSNASPLGIAHIDSRGYSGWGIHVKYTLNGIEETNNNTKIRNVVLHSWDGIQDYWVYPIPIPQSKGCPTVSNKTMEFLDNFIKSQKNKKIIIYSFI